MDTHGPQLFEGTNIRFERHELLQNGWLRANGYGGSQFTGQNPAIAVSRGLHRSTINVEQRLAGLHKPSFLRGMSAYDNIRGNIAVLKASGVDRNVIARAARDARNYAKSLPCP